MAFEFMVTKSRALIMEHRNRLEKYTLLFILVTLPRLYRLTTSNNSTKTLHYKQRTKHLQLM